MITRLSNLIRDHIIYRHIPLRMMYYLDLGRFFIRGSRYPLAVNHEGLSCQPFFIISPGRSGSTLLRSMLAVGGQIAIPPESQVIPLSIRRYNALHFLGWEDLSRLIISLFESHRNFQMWQITLLVAYQTVLSLPENERSLARIIDEIFSCYKAQQFPDAEIWGDKSPLNSIYLPWIILTFPYARYLHLLRDGRDVVASMMEKGGITLKHATRRWNSSIRNAINLRNQLPVEQFLEVRYEQLVTKPTDTLEEVCQFIGIDYQAAMLDFWKSDTTIEHRYKIAHRNLEMPVFENSVGKWETRLSSKQQAYVLRMTVPLLRKLGYE